MEEHRQALQLRVQLDPDVGLHSKRRLRHDPASEEHQQRLDNPEGDGRRAECVQAAPIRLGNGPVDHRPGDERDDNRRRDAQTGEDGHRDEAQRVRTQVGAETPQRHPRPCARRPVPAHRHRAQRH